MVRARGIVMEVERNLELSISQGNYPAEVWCRYSQHYVCPTKLLNREIAVEWLGIVILDSPPIPCRDSFDDTDSPWVESLVCPLGTYRVGLNDPREWGSSDMMNKGDFDVLKEQFLRLGGG